MKKHSTPRERVEFGLDSIPADRKVTVSLRDLMFVHQTLAEFVKFFHQPMHYPDLESVERFLGSKNSGDAFDVLGECVYKRMRKMVPPDIDEAFVDARFDHPLPPEYYSEK